MQFSIFVLLICFFIFLYCVYVLANDDFIFLRRDVTMEKLFNMVFLGSFVSLFVARFFYGFSHSESIFSSFLVFLFIPYFPGLSLLGGVIGAGGYLLFLVTRKENSLPIGRISDFFSIAFLISVSIGFVGYLLFLEENASVFKMGVQAVLYFVLFLVFLKFFLSELLSGKFKEGTIAFIFLICFSVVNLASNAFPKVSISGYFSNFENIVSIFILFLSLTVLIWRENLLLRMGHFKKGK